MLGTLTADGSLRQSVVYFAIDGDRFLISTEANRAKTHDVARNNRASLCVVGTSRPYPSATLEGAARVRTTAIGADTGAVMARMLGEETSEPPTDEMLAAAGRVIIEIIVERVYGVSYIKTET